MTWAVTEGDKGKIGPFTSGPVLDHPLLGVHHQSALHPIRDGVPDLRGLHRYKAEMLFSRGSSEVTSLPLKNPYTSARAAAWRANRPRGPPDTVRATPPAVAMEPIDLVAPLRTQRTPHTYRHALPQLGMSG